jgi:hypothetical protein
MTSHDAELLALEREHDGLWNEWCSLTEDDPRGEHLSGRCLDLEWKILATPVMTSDGLQAKRRLIRRVRGFDDDALLAAFLRADKARCKLGELSDGDSRKADLADRCRDLECRIIATPVTTAAGLRAKRQLVKRVELFEKDRLIAAILAADEARIAG